jgi:hypothetical protein
MDEVAPANQRETDCGAGERDDRTIPMPAAQKSGSNAVQSEDGVRPRMSRSATAVIATR